MKTRNRLQKISDYCAFVLSPENPDDSRTDLRTDIRFPGTGENIKTLFWIVTAIFSVIGISRL